MKTLTSLTTSLLLALPLTAAISVAARPVLSQPESTAPTSIPHRLATPGEGADEANVVRLTDDQMRRRIESTTIRRRLTNLPSEPQAYWKMYITDTFALLCWVNDASNEVEYCDLYM